LHARQHANPSGEVWFQSAQPVTCQRVPVPLRLRSFIV
jgi:hypothetical protein